MILEKVIKKKKTVHYIIGIDEVGRAASKRRASPDCHYIIGIDEVGRGALAGPVTVAALALPLKLKIKIQKSKLQLKNKKSKVHLRDSKKLSAKQREDWFKFIKKSALCCSGRHIAQYIKPAVHYSIASVSPKVIDKINISQAANLAANRAFKKLIANYKLPIAKTKVFLDGGLYLPKFPNSRFHILNSIIKGDEKNPAIALASIVAKVSRDKILKKLHKKCPKYNFDKHKGYGTQKHISLIHRYGLSKFHRKSFKCI